MKIITISGLDGSGKSTQIKFLKEHLESKGKKVFYFHGISFSLPNKILGFFKKKKENGNKSQNSVTKSGKLGVFLRRLVLPIDLFRFKLLSNKLKRKGYDYILSDRYFYDTIVNIEYLSKKTLNCKHPIIKPDKAIYLQADPLAIMTRNKKVPDQGIEFLKEKKEILDNKTDLWKWTILNNDDKDKYETAGEIERIVEK